MFERPTEIDELCALTTLSATRVVPFSSHRHLAPRTTTLPDVATQLTTRSWLHRTSTPVDQARFARNAERLEEIGPNLGDWLASVLDVAPTSIHVLGGWVFGHPPRSELDVVVTSRSGTYGPRRTTVSSPSSMPYLANVDEVDAHVVPTTVKQVGTRWLAKVAALGFGGCVQLTGKWPAFGPPTFQDRLAHAYDLTRSSLTYLGRDDRKVAARLTEAVAVVRDATGHTIALGETNLAGQISTCARAIAGLYWGGLGDRRASSCRRPYDRMRG